MPHQMLLGFEKVRIQPGELRRVTVAVPAARLRLVSAAGEYAILRGRYELHVGGRGPDRDGTAADQLLQAPLRARVEAV